MKGHLFGNITAGSLTNGDTNHACEFEENGPLISITWDRPPLNVLDLALLRELDQSAERCARTLN